MRGCITGSIELQTITPANRNIADGSYGRLWVDSDVKAVFCRAAIGISSREDIAVGLIKAAIEDRVPNIGIG